MIFRTNVMTWERVARTLAGVLMVACGMFGLESGVLGRTLMVTGALIALTGVLGFCPGRMLARRMLARE